MDDNPTPETLKRWHAQWRTIASNAWRELMLSLTPEQRALYQQWQRAGKQAALCNERMRKRTPIAKRQLAWPQEPPTE